MTYQAQLPVDEIARAVSRAVTLVLSKISTHDFGNTDISCSVVVLHRVHDDSDEDDFQVPRPKKRKGNKVKYVCW